MMSAEAGVIDGMRKSSRTGGVKTGSVEADTGCGSGVTAPGAKENREVVHGVVRGPWCDVHVPAISTM